MAGDDSRPPGPGPASGAHRSNSDRRGRRVLLAVAGVLLLVAAAIVVALGKRSTDPAGCVRPEGCPTNLAGADPSLAQTSATGQSAAPPSPRAAEASPTGAAAAAGPSAKADTTGGGRYPARFSVGAPGVSRYRQSDARLPVPAGYQQVFPHDEASKEWHLYTCDGTVNLDHMYFHAYVYIGTDCHGTVNITNSIIAPPPGSANRAVLVNANASGRLRLNISDTTIRPEPVGLGGQNAPLNDHAINDCATCTISLNRVDVANTGGMCLCGTNTTIEYSWLHDNYIANLVDPSQAHTGGVFPYGGSGPLEIGHSRLEPGVDAYTGRPIPRYWQAITAVLFTQSAGGSILRDYRVHDSFLSLGAFGLYAQNGVGLRLRDNVFGPTHWEHAQGCGQGCPVTFAEWTNNVVGAVDGTPTRELVPKPS